MIIDRESEYKRASLTFDSPFLLLGPVFMTSENTLTHPIVHLYW